MIHLNPEVLLLGKILLDAGNVIFFLGSLPQIVTAYKNRKDLKGLSSWMLAFFLCSTLCFLSAGILFLAPMTIILCSFNELFFALQLYWKKRYRK